MESTRKLSWILFTICLEDNSLYIKNVILKRVTFYIGFGKFYFRFEAI